MASKLLALSAGLVALAVGSAASACGQMGPVEPAKPGTKVQIHAYGYGYEGGDRPVTLVWAASGAVAGRAQIDATGAFLVAIQAPEQPGQHGLLVLEGDSDPAPASVTVTVLGVGA